MTANATISDRDRAAQVREWIELQIGSTSWWRSERSEENPDDSRNKEAVDLLDGISSTLSEVPDEILIAFDKMFDAGAESGDTEEIVRFSEALRSIGFHSEPATARDLIQGFISEPR